MPQFTTSTAGEVLDWVAEQSTLHDGMLMSETAVTCVRDAGMYGVDNNLGSSVMRVHGWTIAGFREDEDGTTVLLVDAGEVVG